MHIFFKDRQRWHRPSPTPPRPLRGRFPEHVRGKCHGRAQLLRHRCETDDQARELHARRTRETHRRERLQDFNHKSQESPVPLISESTTVLKHRRLQTLPPPLPLQRHKMGRARPDTSLRHGDGRSKQPGTPSGPSRNRPQLLTPLTHLQHNITCNAYAPGIVGTGKSPKNNPLLSNETLLPLSPSFSPRH